MGVEKGANQAANLSSREAARSDVFDNIEMFYNSVRRHGSADDSPPVELRELRAKRFLSVYEALAGRHHSYTRMAS